MTNAEIKRIAEIVALVMTQQAGKPVKQAAIRKAGQAMKQALPAADRKAAFRDKVLSTFKKAGFADVSPMENVLTYKRWTAKGMKAKPGQKAIKVDGVPLFHITQCEPMIG